jgi:hypothetical protein
MSSPMKAFKFELLNELSLLRKHLVYKQSRKDGKPFPCFV